MLKFVHGASARAEQAPTTVGLDESMPPGRPRDAEVALLAER
jgi:hypothetical protein